MLMIKYEEFIKYTNNYKHSSVYSYASHLKVPLRIFSSKVAILINSANRIYHVIFSYQFFDFFFMHLF